MAAERVWEVGYGRIGLIIYEGDLDEQGRINWESVIARGDMFVIPDTESGRNHVQEKLDAQRAAE